MSGGPAWMPGAKRHNGSWGSSNPYAGGKPKVIWHTTESDPGSTPGNLAWAASQGYGPHLWWDPETGELTQSLPATTPATAVADPDGEGTNRWGSVVIQIEVIGRAARAPLAESKLIGLAEVMDWLRSWGIPDQWPAGVPKGAVSGNRGVYAPSSPAGHYSHSQIPKNSHVDPGRVDPDRLFSEGDDVTPQELRQAIREEVWGHAVKTSAKDTIPFSAAVNGWQRSRSTAAIAAASSRATTKALKAAGLLAADVDEDALAAAVVAELAAELTD